MRNIRRFLLVSIFIVVVVVVPAEASDFTLFGGVQHPGNITLGSAVPEGTDFVLHPKDFGVFGIRTSRGTAVGSEYTIAIAPNFLESRTKALFFNTNLIVQGPPLAVRPYVTVGLGALHTFGDGLGDVGTKFAFNYGGGLKVGGPVGARLDVRGYTIPGVYSQTLNVLEVSLGVIFSY